MSNSVKDWPIVQVFQDKARWLNLSCGKKGSLWTIEHDSNIIALRHDGYVSIAINGFVKGEFLATDYYMVNRAFRILLELE